MDLNPRTGDGVGGALVPDGSHLPWAAGRRIGGDTDRAEAIAGIGCGNGGGCTVGTTFTERTHLGGETDLAVVFCERSVVFGEHAVVFGESVVVIGDVNGRNDPEPEEGALLDVPAAICSFKDFIRPSASPSRTCNLCSASTA